MTPLAWGLVVAIACVAALAWLLPMYFKAKKKEEEEATTRERWSKTISEDDMPHGPVHPDKPVGLGALIFGDGSKKKPITTLHDGDEVWCVTPLGVMNGTVANSVIDCGILEITPRFVPDYFSQEVADKLGVPTAVWVVDDIRDPLKMIGYKLGKKSGIKPVSNFKMTGAKWIRDNSFFCDFLDIMVEELWFEFIFDGFGHSIDWYEGLEPLFVDGERTGGLETYLENAEPPTPEVPVVEIDYTKNDDVAFVENEKHYEPPEEVPPSYSYGVDVGNSDGDGGNSSSYGGGGYDDSDSGGGDYGGGDDD